MAARRWSTISARKAINAAGGTVGQETISFRWPGAGLTAWGAADYLAFEHGFRVLKMNKPKPRRRGR